MKKQKSYTKAICKVLLSQVGLSAIVFVYCIIGGYIFEYLEKKNEENICHDTYAEYKAMEEIAKTKIYNAMLISYEKSLLEYQIKHILKVFSENSVNIGYDGTNCTAYGEPDGHSYQWSFAGAFFFCITVISTIGYGHIAPKTVWGRWVCIAYAVLGIPLFLTCLAVVGGALSDIFKYTYINAFCFGWCKSGYDKGKLTLKKNKYNDERKIKIRGNDEDGLCDSMVTTSYENDESDEEENTNLPLTMVVIFLLSFVTAGALLFGYWEDWDMMQSIYFVFVTLTTIGFGDVTPGTEFKEPKAKAQLALGGIFMLVGLALVTMCFALIQDQIIDIARQIGKKLGLVDGKAK